MLQNRVKEVVLNVIHFNLTKILQLCKALSETLRYYINLKQVRTKQHKSFTSDVCRAHRIIKLSSSSIEYSAE